MVKKYFTLFEKDLPSVRKRFQDISKREGIMFGPAKLAPKNKQIAHIAGYKTYKAKVLKF